MVLKDEIRHALRVPLLKVRDEVVELLELLAKDAGGVRGRVRSCVGCQ